MKKKVVLGLTGGFGSGKSTAREIFQSFGAKCFDCDQAAHEALKKNSTPYKSIVKIFGKDILNKDKSINRTELGKIVFRSATKKKKLEKIIHPFVFQKLSAFVKKNKTGLLVAEVPLLFEAKATDYFDAIAVVFTPKKEILKRLKKKYPHLTMKELNQRIRSQMPLRQKCRLADYVLKNHQPKKLVESIRQTIQDLTIQP